MRDDFSAAVKRRLAERAGYTCSNPECQAPTIGPQAVEDKSVNVGVASHISGAAAGGPRYDQLLTTVQRSSIRNGIWLCANCGTLVDHDDSAHSVELLQTWRAQAEARARRGIGKAKPISDPKVPSLSLRVEPCEGVAMAHYFLEVSGKESAFNIHFQPWESGDYEIIFYAAEVPMISPANKHKGSVFVYRRLGDTSTKTVPLLDYLSQLPERQATVRVIFQSGGDRRFQRTFVLKRPILTDRIDCFRGELTQLL
jgi:hypothetical protein